MKNGCLLLVLAAGIAAAQPFARASLEPVANRKPAAAFALKDSSGTVADLQQYRGKVLLLDFWATWCTGCKQEIPWFVEFQKKFGEQKFAVVGVSLDEEGWKVLKPFLAAHPIPYRIVLGTQATARSYSIESMPDTFLIDQKGRVAAAYRGSLVDRSDVETHIGQLMAEK